MKIDLHIHSGTGSDGAFTLEEIFAEAEKRGIYLLSITDHDAIHHQGRAVELAAHHGLRYVTGVELNVTFPHGGKERSLDFLGYGYDYQDTALGEKLDLIREHRAARARQVVDNLNREFEKEALPLFTDDDLHKMQEGIDGILSRPHIADYLVNKGAVKDRQEAFDKYLVTCDVPKYPLSLPDASRLIRKAGGKLVLAHPNDPNGTSLISMTENLAEQTGIVRGEMMEYIDGIECWHSRAGRTTTRHYINFCRTNGLIMTGGSDCHQKPLVLGTVDVPDEVAAQFGGISV
ncbi:MAG: PHP domain-containing protein [Dehalococcoidales bacterium]|nr:PHP domain-containing protein [Dehalococcoidales bacterium]